MNCIFEKLRTVDELTFYECQLCSAVVKTLKSKPPKRNCKVATEHNIKVDNLDCRHRGEILREESCNVCGQGGKSVGIFSCQIHGECVRRQHRTPASIYDCVRCMATESGFAPPTFPAVKQSDCGVIAVTSFAPNHKAMDAVKSWQNAGVLVVAIQPRDELEKVKSIYGDLVDYYLPTDQDARYQFGKPLVFIWELAELANDTYRPIMLINSDIEIHGDNKTLVSLAEKARDSLVVGVRHNFSDWRQTSLERHGLDVFFINRNFANSLPHLPLCMGKPLWDYWLPKHAQKIGQEIEIFEEPLFFHRKHDLQWSGEDWLRMTRILQDSGYEFGVTRYDDLRAAEQQAGLFRESLRMEKCYAG